MIVNKGIITLLFASAFIGCRDLNSMQSPGDDLVNQNGPSIDEHPLVVAAVERDFNALRGNLTPKVNKHFLMRAFMITVQHGYQGEIEFFIPHVLARIGGTALAQARDFLVQLLAGRLTNTVRSRYLEARELLENNLQLLQISQNLNLN